MLGQEVSALLAERDIPHSFIDLDALAQTFPRPQGDRYGTALAPRPR